MASIKQYKGPWRATVKRKGHGVLVKHFRPRTKRSYGQENKSGVLGLLDCHGS